MKNVKIHFPVIDDVGMKIAKTYGMLHPGESNTKAVRAVFSSIRKASSGRFCTIRWHWDATSTK